MDCHAAAREVFKVSRLKDKQVQAIEALLAGKNVIAVLPTGFGKSLCYQVAAVVQPGFTLVISPLLALCKVPQLYIPCTTIIYSVFMYTTTSLSFL